MLAKFAANQTFGSGAASAETGLSLLIVATELEPIEDGLT